MTSNSFEHLVYCLKQYTLINIKNLICFEALFRFVWPKICYNDIKLSKLISLFIIFALNLQPQEGNIFRLIEMFIEI